LSDTNVHLGILLEGCRKNDRASQKQLYDLLSGFALKTCYSFGAYPVQDIAHEGFIKFFKYIDQFDETRYEDMLATLKGWFKRILINTCIDHYRKNAAYKKIKFLTKEPEEIQDHGSNGFDNLSYKEIISAIAELPPAYKTVFNLFVVEGLSHEEIARHLSISVGTSKSNLFKAREKLKSILSQKGKCKVGQGNGLPGQLSFG